MNRHKLQEAIARNKNFTPTRKVSLYSSFARLEEVNPDGYEANITAWKEVFEDAIHNDAFADLTCIEVSPELLMNLTDPENGMPLSIPSVIDRLVQDGVIMPLAAFNASYPASSSKGLASHAWKAAGWVFGWLSSSYSGKKSSVANGLKPEKYVHMPSLREKSSLLVDELTKSAELLGNSYVSKVFDEAQVQEITSKIGFSKLDIECCLAFGNANRSLVFDKDADVIKLVAAGPITDVDVTISSLRRQINNLAKREEALAHQAKEYERKAKAAIKESRATAKSMLQKKLDTEKSQERTMAALDQLDTVLRKIDDAKDNKEALLALQSSSLALSELNKSLSVDDVDEVIDQLQQAVADTDDVTNSLADLNIGKSKVDREMIDLEIDDELERLNEEESAKAIDSKLPSAPKHKPVVAEPKLDPEERGKESNRNAEIAPQTA